MHSKAVLIPSRTGLIFAVDRRVMARTQRWFCTTSGYTIARESHEDKGFVPVT